MKKLYFLFLALITSLFVKAQTPCTATNSPTFQVGYSSTLANQGSFTVGCNQQSVTTICIVNANTNPTPGGALQFGFIAPGGATVAQSQCITVSTPGTWTFVVEDVNNGCQTRQAVSVIQNTVAPTVSINIPRSWLGCDTLSSMIMTATSIPSNVNYKWYLNSTVFVQSATMLVHTNTSVPNSAVAATYTLMVTDLNNGCVTNSVITIPQNIFPPIAVISATSKTITCVTPSVQLINTSQSTYPSGMSPVVVTLWQGPSPQPTAGLISSYFAQTPGVYTMTVRDENNRCTSYTTITIQDGNPVINSFLFQLCTNTVEIYPTLADNTTSYS